MFQRRSALVGSISRLQDLLLTALSFFIAYLIRVLVLTRMVGGMIQPRIYPLRDYWTLFVGVLVVWFVGGHLLGVYQDIELRGRRQLVLDIAKLVLFGLVTLNAGFYLFRADFISRSFVLTIVGVDFVVLVIGRWLSSWGSSWLREKLQRHHHCLIVGTGPAALELAALMEESEHLGLRLIGFISLENQPVSSPAGLRADYPVFGLKDADDILRNRVVDEVLLAVGVDELERLGPLIGRCQDEGVRTRVDLGFLPRTFPRAHLENLRHIPLLTLGSGPNDEVALFAKRVADFVLSALALLVLWPFLAVLALLVRLTSPGPVLYRQTRCGLNGRRFTLLKFRSMVEDAESKRAELEPLNEMEGAVFKIADDPRVTPLGRWLRKFSLDELPQLWNIFWGDMSFVGPRPPLPEEVERYEPWQRRRLRMRPGLTCLWTLEGRNRLLSFDRLVQFDLAYIDNWSLWLDVKIVLKTIPHVALGRGAS